MLVSYFLGRGWRLWVCRDCAHDFWFRMAYLEWTKGILNGVRLIGYEVVLWHFAKNLRNFSKKFGIWSPAVLDIGRIYVDYFQPLPLVHILECLAAMSTLRWNECSSKFLL